MARVGHVNISTSTATTAWGFYTKEAAVLAGWTVLESSDGTTASTGDIFTVETDFLNALCWYRMADPAGKREFTFQKQTASGTDRDWRVKYSYDAKFITGGTATATPSATDEMVILGGGTDASPTWAVVSAVNSATMHFVANTVPEGGVYQMWNASFQSGGTLCYGQMVFEGLIVGTYPSVVVDPFVAVIEANAGGTNGFLYANSSSLVGAWGSLTGFHGWYRKGMAGELASQYRLLHGTVAGTQALEVIGPNGHTGKHEGYPFQVARLAADGSGGFLGYTAQSKWMGSPNTTLTYPDTIDLAGDAHIVVGKTLMPWPVGVTPGL